MSVEKTWLTTIEEVEKSQVLEKCYLVFQTRSVFEDENVRKGIIFLLFQWDLSKVVLLFDTSFWMLKK